MSSPFEALDQVDSELEARLRARLIEVAEEQGILDLTYETVETPLGALLLVATPEGLVRVAYEREGHESVLERLADAVSPRILHTPRRLDRARHQIDEYFAGKRRHFELDLDLRLSKGFRRLVLGRLLNIEYGYTRSYAEVAADSGSPRAVRAVGTACATNPLPVVLPCHRVVRSDGKPGEYVGGQEAKQKLLALESH
ncbi:methylated-DNA--[protein]-cysteine S-methyltransferase [Actinocrispum wychmicini]|uniref:Methylated-DNA--protein-cysteine methyltransferase n=1 Tax=Actinocrispum wychmicini TaxID=1213861 RepID=A0A4V2S674_9PSEU|nr:methylated-DNA--[protein]-cysteine S-methyltransferase [Actinocrispum wychmicini]TCO54950.1 methylated-DNA-[protein]-cysteine S-methyltransferase [Actinocrispum wychmicini]